MPPVLLLSLAILTPALLGAATLLLPRRSVAPRVFVGVLAPAISLGLLITYIAQHGIDATVPAVEWMPQIRLNWVLQADRLSLFFALLVAAVGLLIAIYTRAYFGPDRDSLYRFYPSLLLFMTAMLGIVLSDNFLLLLIFWELTSISSFLLIGWERDDPEAVRNALQAFIITGAGGLALMAGFACLGLATGAWSFRELTAVATSPGGITSSPMMIAGFILMFAGAAAKSAQWPTHFWLPGAMAAPTPVSAYLHSATMVKAGIYLVGRLWPMLAAALPLWPRLIIPFGAVTMVWGAFVALRKSDLKQIFAYTTVSQLGLLMTMYGLGGLRFHDEPNLLWDVTQILNHALYKAPLFLVAGAVGHAIHTRELPYMRGLLRRGGEQGIMAALLILAAYALAAGPGTLSFTAKEFFYYQVYHAKASLAPVAFHALAGAAVAVGVLNTAIFVRLARVLLGRPDPEPHADALPPSVEHPAAYVAHHDAAVVDEEPSAEDIDTDIPDHRFWSAMLWVPAAALLLFQFVGGIVPGAYAWLFGWLERPASLNYTFDTLAKFPMTWDAYAHPSVPLYMSIGGGLLGIALGFAPLFRDVMNDVHAKLFPAFYKLAVDGGGRAFGVFQTGYLRTYLTLLALALVGLIAAAIFGTEAIGGLRGYVQLPDDLQLTDSRMLPGYLLAGLMCLAAVLMPVVRDRAGRILVLGTAGTAATALFYVYEAPDLALTQISIEVVSLILFLLVLALLPDTTFRGRTRVAGRLALAVAVGVAMGLLTLAATTGQRPPRVATTLDGAPIADLGDFFLRNSYYGRDTLALSQVQVRGGVVDRGTDHPESFGTHPPVAGGGEVQLHKGGGGANVVNVILVDFRGFDTLGEITVLALAALGVAMLFRRHRGDLLRGAEAAVEATPPFVDTINTTILLQAARLLVPLSLVLSLYIFYKGHQSPGGGFVGGLVAAVALILYRISAGAQALRKRLPVRERLLIAIGLAFAGGSGALALAFGLPFLTSNNGYLPLPPPLGPWHWATVILFDAGVYLVVVGVTVGMIDILSRELERFRTEEQPA